MTLEVGFRLIDGSISSHFSQKVNGGLWKSSQFVMIRAL